MTEQLDPTSDSHWLAAQDRRVDELEAAARAVIEEVDKDAFTATLPGCCALQQLRQVLGDIGDEEPYAHKTRKLARLRAQNPEQESK